MNKKGFGGVASTLIMFIAVIGVTTGLVLAFVNYVENTEQSFTVQNKLTSNKLRTATAITNVYYNSSSENLYVYVKNIGDTKLKTSLFDFFINNKFISTFNTSYANNLSKEILVLQPHETMAIIKNITLNSGTHDVLVSTEFGKGDDDSFNI